MIEPSGRPISLRANAIEKVDVKMRRVVVARARIEAERRILLIPNLDKSVRKSCPQLEWRSCRNGNSGYLLG